MRAWARLLFVLTVAGCGAAPGELSHEYAKNVRKVGLFPVYPPREEFQIGDVYFWSQSISNPNDSVSVYIDTIDWLREKADLFMATRVVFENTERSAAGELADVTDADIPASARRISTRGELPGTSTLPLSLPIAAFPTITADAGFTASFGIVRALSALGLAGGARTQVVVNFNDVRTYWVPNVQVSWLADEHLRKVTRRNAVAGYDELTRLTRARLGADVDPCGAGRRCGASVVTRVYLTRKIDYTYRNARIIAGALQSAAAGSARRAPAAVTINVATNDAGGIDQQTLDATIAAVSEAAAKSVEGDAQGASLQFQAWDARGMTFAQIYQRPVVVGWDGLTTSIGIRGTN